MAFFCRGLYVGGECYQGRLRCCAVAVTCAIAITVAVRESSYCSILLAFQGRFFDPTPNRHTAIKASGMRLTDQFETSSMQPDTRL